MTFAVAVVMLGFRYSMLLLAVTYVVPLAALAAAYTRVAVELWGSKMIGERTAGQDETLKSKRRVIKFTPLT